MGKLYKIRKINWKNKVNEIPKDFLEIMGFFNKAIKDKAFPYVPRKDNPITKKEILTKWIPSKKRTISYVAEDKKSGKIVASAAMFLNRKTKQGHLSITKNPSYKIKNVGTDLAKKIIKETLSKKYSVLTHTFVKNTPAIKIMKNLDCGKGKLIKNYERYRNKIESEKSDVFEWIIEPK